MDRDVVNGLHFLYQKGETELTKLLEKLWCGPDSEPDLLAMVRFRNGKVRLSKQLIRFIKAVEVQMANLPKPDFVFGFPLSQAPRREGEPRPAFVAMPYGPHWFKPVSEVIVKSASSANFQAEISKDLSTPGAITDQIWQGIRRAEVIVADISGHNPNVLYELGMAHALGKEVVLIEQGAEQTPFDIYTSRRILYDLSDLPALESSLMAAFQAVSARYLFEGSQPYF